MTGKDEEDGKVEGLGIKECDNEEGMGGGDEGNTWEDAKVEKETAAEES